MPDRVRERDDFFLYFAWFILAFVVCSFGAKAIFDRDGLPPITYRHHLHALSMGSWFLLFALQPTLIRLGHIRLHRVLGGWSVVVVLTFIAMAAPIATLSFRRTGDPLVFTANLVNLLVFLGFYGAAIAARAKPETHKRLMTYAALAIVGPAAGRIPEIFDASPFLALPIILALQGAMVVHDLRVLKRLHRATVVGLVTFVVSVPLITMLAASEGWVGLLSRVVGQG